MQESDETAETLNPPDRFAEGTECLGAALGAQMLPPDKIVPPQFEAPVATWCHRGIVGKTQTRKQGAVGLAAGWKRGVVYDGGDGSTSCC